MAMRKTRSPKRRATATRRVTRKVSRQWTRQEMAFMRKYYRKFETAWVARQLGRTVYSVRYKAVDLKLRKANPSVWKGNKGTANEFKKAYGTISRPTARKATPKRHAPKRTWRASSKKRSARKPQTRKAIRRTAKRRSR